jgi:hypothetical protein
MAKPTIPDWCKGMPDSIKLYPEDIMEFYGLKSTRANANNVYREIRKGIIPEPLTMDGYAKARKNYWLLGDIRKLSKGEG